MKRSNFHLHLPGKRDKRWMLLLLPTALVIWGMIAGLSATILHIPPTAANGGIWFVLAFIASIAICGFAYAGLYYALGACILGTAAGLFYMAFVFTRNIEGRGIIGLVSGAQLAVLFFLAGINIQMVRRLLHKRVMRGEKK